MTHVASRIWNSTITIPPLSLLDSGLSDLFCLETFTHGTSPSSYNSILKHGANPIFGGNGGETAFFVPGGNDKTAFFEPHTVNRFYVWDHQCRYYSWLPKMCGEIFRATQARLFAIKPSIARELEKGGGSLRKCKGQVVGFVTPIVKFRFQPEESKQYFSNDEFFQPGIACFTDQEISRDHIGIIGTLKQGVNKKWFNRIRENPQQCLAGVTKIIIALALIALGCVAAYYSRIGLYVVMGYLTFTGAQAVASFIIPLFSSTPEIPGKLEADEQSRIMPEIPGKLEAGEQSRIMPEIPGKLEADEQSRIMHVFMQEVSNEENPEAIIFLGCSGSGKTTQIEDMLSRTDKKFVRIDSDLIMKQMAQYNRLLRSGNKNAAQLVHLDSLRLRTALVDQTIRNKMPLIFESTGSNHMVLTNLILKLKNQGYKIKLISCEVSLEEAKRRVQQRNATQDRVVPESAVMYSYEQSTVSFERIKSHVDEHEILRN